MFSHGQTPTTPKQWGFFGWAVCCPITDLDHGHHVMILLRILAFKFSRVYEGITFRWINEEFSRE